MFVGMFPLRIFKISHDAQVSGYTVTWWIDHPVLEVKIIDIRETPHP